jgi:hypothetical protein
MPALHNYEWARDVALSRITTTAYYRCINKLLIHRSLLNLIDNVNNKSKQKHYYILSINHYVLT